MPRLTKQPILSLNSSFIRYRPVVAVTVIGPGGSKVRDGLLDTGADDTVFTEPLAAAIGIDLSKAEERVIAVRSPVECVMHQ